MSETPKKRRKALLDVFSSRGEEAGGDETPERKDDAQGEEWTDEDIQDFSIHSLQYAAATYEDDVDLLPVE